MFEVQFKHLSRRLPYCKAPSIVPRHRVLLWFTLPFFAKKPMISPVLEAGLTSWGSRYLELGALGSLGLVTLTCKNICLRMFSIHC